MDLGIDDDDLAACVGCGLCLPHCPTWRVTGDEALSPRGRIAAMRLVQNAGAPADAPDFGHAVDTCVQCRGCETACPSGVPFGRLIEATKATVADPPWWVRLGYRALGHHRLVVAGSRALAVAQRLRVVPGRLGLPRLPLRNAPLQPTGTDVWLFTGCVMDAWQRPVHAAAQRVLAAAGIGTMLPGRGGDCCGALASHAGLADTARAQARRVMASMPGDAPIVVDSAGCGAALVDYGHLLGTPDAAAFAGRVVDVHTYLDRLDLPERPTDRRRVAVQDPCHLRHVQRAHEPVRRLLARYYEVVDLDDDGLCCGAGGAYATFHPDLAGQVRDRKLERIEVADADVVASANPGCALHLAAAGVAVAHPVELLDAALRCGDAAAAPARQRRRVDRIGEAGEPEASGS